MPMEIVMPKLGLTMAEGQVVEWKKQQGETVKKGEVIFVLETEKVTYEVESPEDGILGKILVHEQETVPIGAIVAYLLRPGEKGDSMEETRQKVEEKTTVKSQPPPASVSPISRQNVSKATPLAKKLAREYGIDLGRIRGSGPGGRIVRADIEKANAIRRAEKLSETLVSGQEIKETLVPLTGMRQIIAKKMLSSKLEAAQAYMSNMVDASCLQECRRDLLEFIEKKFEIRLTITDLMMKITASAISEHPIINSKWTDKGILYQPEINMGMAMALKEGLIVPVIRNISGKCLGEIAVERTALIKKGKKNSLLPDDIKGSTFTLSSLGMYGVEQFTAIINQPESAILAVAAIIDMPVVRNGQIMVKPMMNVSLTYDHRNIDGAEAAKFMQTLKAFIENPILILA